MKQCPNCGIIIGGKEEQKLHSYNGLEICGFCLELLLDRGWLCREKYGDGTRLVISLINGTVYTVPEGKFQPQGKTWRQLQARLKRYRD